ncbi:MAG TPA: hybrid sensor histidine kinase/response regulator [Verrucomicrobiota bacterium]|nr:hybrid sensor histidine kinase/response regulator [Verrucomicrobiota bacterium]HNT15115.1 hybrid sensor histidine kinase/response regulator [Verrucomicrobiota bacterium]
MPRKRGTLLIVDDEAGPRTALRVAFKDEYTVHLAEDGPAAIEIVQRERVDVAILDIRMQGMSGVDVLQRIKFIDPTIEAIMMTAFETTDTIRRALKLRACDYLNKPFDLADMRAAVTNAMQRRTLDTVILNNNEKLQQLYEELQREKVEGQIAQARNEIYASIIHDINNPLTVISGSLQLIHQRLGPEAALDAANLAFVKERLGIVTRQVTNCVEIARRYLSFLRRRPDAFSQIGVNQLLGDFEQLLQVHPSLRGNELAVQPLGQDLAVKMNGTDLIQLLQNLTVNALQATPQAHRVRVSGTVLAAPLALGQFKDAPGERLLNVENFQNIPPLVQLTVSDDGPGIPLEILPRIFEPRFSTKDVRQGTGLGLNIVLRLVKEGNGLLHVKTVPGTGTTFTVYLPALPVLA